MQALLFDVFGTCVDWRGGIIRQGVALGRRLGLSGVDWPTVADSWRALYQPQMEAVRSGRRPWTNLDVLHREALDCVLNDLHLEHVSQSAREELTRAWHRLDPWPDTVEGLSRLKRRFIIAANSNAHIALSVHLARHAGLPWDAILGAEIAQAYKPQPRVYVRSVELLGLDPPQVMMVAAHHSDLAAAAACGLHTAFVPRPLEHGPAQTVEQRPQHRYTVVATDLIDLADQLEA